MSRILFAAALLCAATPATAQTLSTAQLEQLRQVDTRLASIAYRLVTANAFPTTAGTWYTLSLSASGSSLVGSVNGVQLLSISDSSYPTGRAGVVANYTSGSFDDVLVTVSNPARDIVTHYAQADAIAITRSGGD